MAKSVRPRKGKASRKGALRLMLEGLVGVAIGFLLVFGLFTLAGFQPRTGFWYFMGGFVGPAYLYYLWTHRSPDNSRFDLE
jgi:hypothetical protein